MIKNILKKLIYVIFFPYILLLTSFLPEKKIYNLFFKDHFSSLYKTKLGLNKLLILGNYYWLPYILQKKLISASMGNELESLAWAEYYRKKGFPDEDTKYIKGYDYLKSYILKNKNKNCHIHQICASSGREISYFSKISETITFEASDFSKSVVNNIKNHYPNLKTYYIDLSKHTEVVELAKRCDLIVAFGGLQYLIPRELENFFKICKEQSCEIIIANPLASELQINKFYKSIPRGNFSWSHPYLYIASQYGYKTYQFNTYQNPNYLWAKTLSAHFIN